MSWVIYDTFKGDQNRNVNPVDLSSDTIKCLLATAGYTPDVQADQYVGTPQADEVAAGSTYSTGGPTIGSQTWTLAADTWTFSCANIVINQDAAGFTNARYAVLYKDTGTPGTSHLIAYADLGGDKSIQGGSLTLQIDAAGVFTLT